MRRTKVQGTIYLIHFDRPYRHARHYLGWTEGEVARRMEAHASGRGSPLIRAVQAAGIGWRPVASWSGDRRWERRLKNGKHISRECPACRKETA